MSLLQNLTEFKFNLDTLDLTSMGNTAQEITDEMTLLWYTQNNINFMQTSSEILNCPGRRRFSPVILLFIFGNIKLQLCRVYEA
jgi:hypothetical protein